MYVRVAVNVPTDKIFSYAVPKALEKKAMIGKRVCAHFGNRLVTGYIVEILHTADVDNIKEISEILDPEPLFREEDLLFYRWISRYYLYPLGKTLFEVLPGGSDLSQVSPKKERIVSLDAEYLSRGISPVKETSLAVPMTVTRCGDKSNAALPELRDIRLTDRQEQMVDFLLKSGDSFISSLRGEFKNAAYLVRCLQEKGVLRIEEREVYRSSRAQPAIEEIDSPFLLNGDQEAAVCKILQGLAANRFSPYLLHGVTGSGKTEVYFKAMEKTREQGGGVIFLVPEISLTPQIISRIRSRFRDQEIAVIHSGVSRSVRYDQWRRIQKGEVKIAIGARSALFVPMRDLRLVIVDEEHDGSYKQGERLRYNARDMAIVKAKLSNATVILGSATPAVQTYFNARNKKYHYLSLPRRVEYRELPVVEIVDMRNERDKNFEAPILSQAMNQAIGQTLAEKNQTLLFLNRRGFNTVVLCPDCGYVFKCLNCERSLTYHAASGMLKCHYCDFAIRAFPLCPGCGGSHIRSYGVGTEKLEKEVNRIFPQAKIGRMDSDTTTRRGDAEKILKALARQEIDILIGTQMITKGHDYPGITLVGVVSADMSLNVPDFRAGERTFQILTQVAGRGGRGAMPGNVIVQTFNPGHYAVKMAQSHDYQAFYAEEIKLRRSLSYPPYARLVNLHISSNRKDQGISGIDRIGKLVKNLSGNNNMGKKVEVLGPAASPVAKIKGRYRWQLLLKGKDINAQCAIVDVIRKEAVKIGLEVKVDVDPMDFM
ncbi:MAG: primosomal protein N' [Syntrophales bacterium]|nr:primosomal protein N' [Syntrophales bacterium]